MSKSHRGAAPTVRPDRHISSKGSTNTAPPTATSGLAGWRKRHPMLFTLLPVALVVLAIVTMVVIKTTGGSATTAGSRATSTLTPGSHSTGTGNGTTALPAGVLADVASVSPSTLAAIGDPSGLSLPAKITGKQAVLIASDGKPEVLYIGAEFCPFCAAERWAMVQALSRFGTFSGLSATHSSTSDEFPDTQTFSFYGSTYTSPYLDFTPVEEETNQIVGGGYGALQQPTAAENSLLSTFDVAPYTSEPGSIPFVDIGNQYLIVGASYNPQILQGLSMRDIAKDLNDPSSVVATAIDGTDH
jgi:hypothetical protein